MAKQTRHTPPVADPFVGKSVRIKGECVVLAHYPAAASVPDRVMVRVGDLTTVVPSTSVEVIQ
jgi:calcineurin-like phosphoesterase family protein